MGMGFFVAVSNWVLILLFLFLIIGFQPGLAAEHHRHRHRRLAADIPGFIYIDCGASDDRINANLGLTYRSDKSFVESGETRWISPQSRKGHGMLYWSLRSFPQGERNCYTVKLDDDEDDNANKSSTYLIRAVFLYGNYDGRNQTPIFDLYIGVIRWATVRLDWGAAEANYVSSTDNHLQVCLVNIGNGIPYISALEIRRLDSSIYPIQNRHFTSLWKRFDIGSSYNAKFSRYPVDVKYDRFWLPLHDDEWSSISTKEVIPTGPDDLFKVPQQVLATASRPRNSSSPLNYVFIPKVGTSLLYFCLHFVEIEKLEAGQLREMRIVLNNANTITPSIKLEYLKRQTICSNGLKVNLGQENYLSISATPNSTLSPILNALEIFSSTELINSPTFLRDVNAMMDIKQSYKVGKNWQGDPCIPTSYIWEGLNCSDHASSPRIVSLNLSRSKLTGDIVFSFSNLTDLESLDLSDNDLRGPVPDFFAQLPRLKLLILTGNKFTGLVPETLLRKSKDGTLLLSVNANPELCLSPPCKDKKKFAVPVLAYIIPTVVLFGLILLAILMIIGKKRKQNSSTELNRKGALKPKNQQFSYFEVVIITDNFKTTVGEGGFGKVYLGTLKDKTLVAVKLLSSTSKQGYKEFQAEAQLLTIIHHRNLVSLVGYCDEGDNKVLIYEYMANGNLQQCLSERSTKVLSWTERLQIAVDAAQGLEYLHNGCKPSIIHRDMKTPNILLNDKMQAKIADFGLSRILASESATHLSTAPAGTIGYIDPEVHSSGNFTRKSDVYSFGIVLLELITGQAVIIRSEERGVHITSWIKPLIEEGNIENIVDSRLRDTMESFSVWKAIEIAVSCTLPTSEHRPDMSCVVIELIECLTMAQCRTLQIPPENHEICSFGSNGSESIFSPR